MEMYNITSRISNYVADRYSTGEYLIYGSFAEYIKGYITEPHDIDIIIAVPKHSNSESYEINIDGIDIPVQVNTMTKYEIYAEVNNLEPKYLIIDYPFSSYSLTETIENILDQKTKSSIRSAISSISSKAYNKGKKKLTIADDYNEYLGLKNIYHSFKFVHAAMRKLLPLPHIDSQFLKDKDIMEMYDIKCLIWNTYNNSTGTKQERWEILDKVTKPLYNTYMTEFRKHFPKEIKNG